MKWPTSITLLRHGESAYNILRRKKEKDPDYQLLKKAYAEDFRSSEAVRLATLVRNKWKLGVSDYETPLTEQGKKQAYVTGRQLPKTIDLPDVIMVSPYLRTRQTLAEVERGWPALKKVNRISDDRIREQEHGLSLLYNDWRVFHVFHPEQKFLYDLMKPYWYQYPQGESTSDVRKRCREEVSMLIREFFEKKVLLVTHHLTILSFMANIGHFSPEKFLEMDEKQKPLNCGVTHYVGVPGEGRDGRLKLDFYNRILY
jgi:broad specificity phosphatase PhoE